VGLADVGKGALPVLVGKTLGLSVPEQMWVGLAIIAGHNWSVFLNLRGGRGVGPAMGVLMVVSWPELIVFIVVGLAFVGLRFAPRVRADIIPVGVGLGVLALPISSVVFGHRLAIVLGMTGVVLLLAAKRLMGNFEPVRRYGPARRVLLNRLVLDRDVRDRRAWISRRPDDGQAWGSTMPRSRTGG